MSTTTAATIEFGETNWSTAEIWKWENGFGDMVAQAHLSNGTCQVRMLDDTGRFLRWLPGKFAKPADALAAVRKELGL